MNGETPAVLFSEAQIRSRVVELGGEIAKSYVGEELCVVGLMKNCLVFTADLIRAIPLPTTCYLVRASQGGTGGTEIVYSAEMPYAGRHILLLVDIIDTGITLKYLLEHIRDHEPKSLRVCALLDKARERKVDLKPDWVVFALPEPVDRFLVGYGMDFKEQYRGLPYIGTLSRPAPEAQGGKLNMSENE